MPPSTLCPDGACRKLVDHRRDPTYDLGCQATLPRLRSKVPAPATGARGSHTEDFGWTHRSSQLQQLLSDRLRGGQIRRFWRICRPTDHPEHPRPLPIWLGAWAEDVAVSSHDVILRKCLHSQERLHSQECQVGSESQVDSRRGSLQPYT